MRTITIPLDELNVAHIFFCYDEACGQPFIGTTPTCPYCLSGNCRILGDESLIPIRADSVLGRELSEQLGLAEP